MPSTSLTIPLPPKPKSTWLAWLLIAPSIVMLLAVTVFPLFFALKNSFYFWNLQMGPQPLGFIGWGNYQMALTRDTFWVPLVNTVLLTVAGTVLEVLAGLAVAAAPLPQRAGHECGAGAADHADDDRADRGRLPVPLHVRPDRRADPLAAAAACIPASGRGPARLQLDGAAGILFADIWQWTPFCAIVFYAALLAVPQGLVEAARLDGAGAWETFRRIKLPLIRKTSPWW